MSYLKIARDLEMSGSPHFPSPWGRFTEIQPHFWLEESRIFRTCLSFSFQGGWKGCLWNVFMVHFTGKGWGCLHGVLGMTCFLRLWSSAKVKGQGASLQKLRSWNSCRGAVKTNLTRNHEVVCSIPGLTQWVQDLALPWAVVWVEDVARIPHCCGCGVGWQLQLWFNP